MCRWIGSAAASPSSTATTPGADQRGFTLIEVLVAFAIAALLLTAVLRALTGGLAGSHRASAYAQATALAESTLDALGIVKPLADGEVADLTAGPFHVHSATRRYHGPGAVEGDSQYLVLYRLAVTVSWRDGRRPRSVSLQTLRLGPPG